MEHEITTAEKAKKLLLNDFTLVDEIKGKSNDIISCYAGVGVFNDNVARQGVIEALASYLSELRQFKRITDFHVGASGPDTYQIVVQLSPILETVTIDLMVQ